MYYKDIFVRQIKLLSQTELPPLPPLSSSELDELRESIKKYGILQPLLVTAESDDAYLLQSGYNRLRVARELDLHVVPCCVSTKTDGVTGILMGSDTDGFRRHLTPDQKKELLLWQKGLKLVKKPSPPLKSRSLPPSKDNESIMMKNVINEQKELIKNLRHEMDATKKVFNQKIESLDEDLKAKKKKIKELREIHQRAKDDIEEARFKYHEEAPTDDERVKKLEDDLREANERANRVLAELEGAREETEKIEDQLCKEKNARKSITAGLHARLYRQRQEDKARDKLRVAEGLLEDTQRMLDEVADIVRRDEVCVDTEAFVTSIKKLTEAVSAIPYYPSKDEPGEVVNQ